MTRKTLKIVHPLILSVAAVFLLFVKHQLETEKRMVRNNLSHSAKILGESLRVDFEQALRRPIEPAAVTGHLDFLSGTGMALDQVSAEPDCLGAPAVTSALFMHTVTTILQERLA